MIHRSPWPDVAIPRTSYGDFVFADTDGWADRPAFIDGPSGRTLTHGQVRASAHRVAAALVQRGLRKGDVLAIASPNLPEYAVAFHGVAFAGGVVTTANPLYSADELAHQLNDAGARFLLTVPALLDKACQAAAQSRVEEVFVFGEADGATPFQALLQDDGEPPEASTDPASDLLVLPYSRGTTGRAKGVMLTHRNAVAMLAQYAPMAPDVRGHRSIAVLPFFHCYGMTVMNGVLRRGTTSVTMPRFVFEEFLSLIERHRITTLGLVPPIVLALARHPAVADHDLSSLRVVTSGAAPLGAALQQAAGERIGLPIRQGYGLTEATFAVTGLPIDELPTKPGGVGRLLPNVEARILDPASGEDLGPHLRGELLLRGPNVMRGYLNQPEATAAMLDADGWLHTGDVALFDDDGELFIVDRLKELIKVKGYQVAPAQLEAVLLQHPAVADAAVIGVADDEAGELPKAFVVLRVAGTSPETIMAETARRLAPHERIRVVEFVDAIPKSPSGKILRRVLRDREAGR
jgi:acyl-CoA synthetase (AMP-forming)/AMP-acid ligase II